MHRDYINTNYMFKYIKWFLLVLFITYYSSVAIFMHTHIEEGAVIVHSHPFSKSTDGTPHHHQSLAEILFFHNLSTINTIDGIVNSFQLILYTQVILLLDNLPVKPAYLNPVSACLFLRAPPFFN